MPLDRVLTKGAKKLRLVILDACRENPFAAKMASACSTRSIGRGFVAGQGRTVAQDGDGLNSPFAQSLLEHLGEAGLEINMLFRHMHDDVKARTAGQQEPFTFGALPAEALFFKAASQ